MDASLIPAVIDAIVATARTALPGASIYDGYGVCDDPGDFLMVGVPDPENDSISESASSQQEWANLGAFNRDETGEIQCVALSWNGNGDQKAARDAAYAMVKALSTAIRDNPSMGVPGLLWAGCPVSTILRQNQNDDGAEAVLQFSVGIRARV